MGPVMGQENKIWLRIGKGLHVQYLRGYFSGFWILLLKKKNSLSVLEHRKADKDVF